MLRSLIALADRLEEKGSPAITPVGFAQVPIRWILPIDLEGKLRRAPMRTTSGTQDDPQRFVAPELVRSSGIKPKLLSDNAEYTLGIGAKEDDPKVARRHAAYRALIRDCAEATGAHEVGAVATFLEEGKLADLAFDGDFDPADRITFDVDECMPMHLSAVERFWMERVVGHDAPVGRDLLTGESGPLMVTEPTKLKRIPGGQSSGTNLVSGNADAFLSYGATQSLIAPILVRHADRYAKALNHLLQAEQHNLRVGGDLVYVFWTDEGWVPPVKAVLEGERSDAFESLFGDLPHPRSLDLPPDPEDVRRALQSVWSRRHPGDGRHDAAFHAAALSASGARAIVRDHITTTVQRARENLRAYVERGSMVDGDGRAGLPVGTFALSASLYHDARRQMSPDVPSRLIEHALDGRPLPSSLLDALARRNAVERRVTRPRAVLARLVLTSLEVDMNEMDQLNLDRPEASYHLGRLLAALDQLQYEALGSVGATLVDRFYGSFSTAPASVMGRLMQSAQDYVGKIRSEKGPGAGVRAESDLSDILVHVQEVPDTLDSRDQALFSLGYYHQRAAHWRAVRAHKEASKAGAEEGTA